MRVLVITKIFPNALDPAFAPYNRHQFAALGKRCDVEVLALIPWFPAARAWQRFTKAGRVSGVPRREIIDGLTVHHPRVLYVPKVGQPFSGLTYTASLLPHVLSRRGHVDVVLGSFAYPDGWSAVALARILGVPAVVKVHGSDINVQSQVSWLKPNLSWALSRAAAVVGPSQALVDAAIALGAPANSSRAVFNGVDTTLFKLRDRTECRRRLGQPTDGRWILFVGRLEPQKGIQELLAAFAQLTAQRPDLRLVLVGTGVSQDECETLVKTKNLPVIMAGKVPHEQVALWLGACDVLTLPSWAEGTPNVVIEALVSGRRVVATKVGGIPAVLDRPVLGELVPPRDPQQLSAALARAVDTSYLPENIRESVDFGDWNSSAGALFSVLEKAVAEKTTTTSPKTR